MEPDESSSYIRLLTTDTEPPSNPVLNLRYYWHDDDGDWHSVCLFGTGDEEPTPDDILFASMPLEWRTDALLTYVTYLGNAYNRAYPMVHYALQARDDIYEASDILNTTDLYNLYDAIKEHLNA